MLSLFIPFVLGASVIPVVAQFNNKTEPGIGAQTLVRESLVSVTDVDFQTNGLVPAILTSVLPDVATSVVPATLTSVLPGVVTSVVPTDIQPTTIPDAGTTTISDAGTTTISHAGTTTIPDVVSTSLPNSLPTTLPTILPTTLPNSLPTTLPTVLSTTLPNSPPTTGPVVVPGTLPEPLLPASVESSALTFTIGTSTVISVQSSISPTSISDLPIIPIPLTSILPTSVVPDVSSRSAIITPNSGPTEGVAVSVPNPSSGAVSSAIGSVSGDAPPNTSSSASLRAVPPSSSLDSNTPSALSSVQDPNVQATFTSNPQTSDDSASASLSVSQVAVGVAASTSGSLFSQNTNFSFADAQQSATPDVSTLADSFPASITESAQTTKPSGLGELDRTTRESAVSAQPSASSIVASQFSGASQDPQVGGLSLTNESTFATSTSVGSSSAIPAMASTGIPNPISSVTSLTSSLSSAESRAPNRLIADRTTSQSSSSVLLESGQSSELGQVSASPTSEKDSDFTNAAFTSTAGTNVVPSGDADAASGSTMSVATTFSTGTLTAGNTFSDDASSIASASGFAGSSVSTSAISPTGASTNATAVVGRSGNSSTPMIVGATIGSIIGAALSAFALIFFCLRHKQRKRGRRSMYEQPPMIVASRAPSRMSMSSRATTLARGVEMDAEGSDGRGTPEPDYDDGEIRDLHERGCLAQMQRIIRQIFELETVERPQELETVEKPQELEAEETTCLAATQAFLMRMLGLDQHKFEEVENVDYLDELKKHEQRKFGQFDPSRRTSVTFAVSDKDYIMEVKGQNRAKGQEEQETTSEEGSNEEWTEIDFIEEIKAQNRKHFGHPGLSSQRGNGTSPIRKLTTQRESMIHPALRDPEPLVSPIAELNSRAILSPIMEHGSRPGSIISPLTEIKSQASSVEKPSPNLRSQQGSQRSMSTITSKKSSGETTQTAEGLEDFMDWMSKHKSPPTSP